MIRLTAREAQRLFDFAKRGRVSRPRTTENHVEAQCIGWLQTQGWEVIRQQSGLFARPNSEARVRIGQVGAADWLCIRPRELGTCDLFFLECKAPGKRPTQQQELWMQRQHAGGMRAVWFDSLDKLRAWYRDTWH